MFVGRGEEVESKDEETSAAASSIEKSPIHSLMMSFGECLGLTGPVWVTLGCAWEPRAKRERVS